MEIPELGPVTKDEDLEWYCSEPIPVPVLGGQMCSFVVEGYDDDDDKEAFHEAIRNFLSIDDSVLKAAEEHIYRYYEDCNKFWEPDDEEYLSLESPKEVWPHVRLGTEPMVSRRPYGDKGVYISLGCGCDWEVEHGLMIVFKNGLRVNKIGGYDGHLTNSDAYGDKRLEDVIYK